MMHLLGELMDISITGMEIFITVLILQPPTDLDNSISYLWIIWIIIGIISGEPDMKPEGSGFYVHWPWTD